MTEYWGVILSVFIISRLECHCDKIAQTINIARDLKIHVTLQYTIYLNMKLASTSNPLNCSIPGPETEAM